MTTKSTIKKYLKGLSDTEKQKLLLDVYDKCKDAKEYIDYQVNPDENAKLEEYKKVIKNQFYPERG